ncbi:hypothetical protein ABT144_08495 [Streptomyces sp. NPDC002039]|uniref:hypothetical protein n=1 Tax=Streptomyces sp. NPDC002039 TaxID=3154660 RepID=UPI00333312F5
MTARPSGAGLTGRKGGGKRNHKRRPLRSTAHGGPASPAPDGDEEVVPFERHLEVVRVRPARR